MKVFKCLQPSLFQTAYSAYQILLLVTTQFCVIDSVLFKNVFKCKKKKKQKTKIKHLKKEWFNHLGIYFLAFCSVLFWSFVVVMT